MRLRDEQDREYREAEEADRRAREQNERDEAAREQQMEEERQQKELQDAIELSKKLSRDDHLQRTRSNIGSEPAAGSPGTATIRFQLPRGIKTSRRFMREDKVQVLQFIVLFYLNLKTNYFHAWYVIFSQKIFDYLEVYFADNNIDIRNFTVGTNFPKKTFVDMEATIEGESLYPNGTLFVLDADA